MYIYLLVTVKNIPKAIPDTQKTRQNSSISLCFYVSNMYTWDRDVDQTYFPN